MLLERKLKLQNRVTNFMYLKCGVISLFILLLEIKVAKGVRQNEVTKKAEELQTSNLTSLLEKVFRKDYIANVNYEKPSVWELDLGTRLFTSLLSSGEVTGEENLEWASLGFSFNELLPGKLGVISELSPKGHGCYVVKLKGEARRKSGKEVVLQAPHKLYDLLTDSIAIRLFAEGDFSAVAISTTDRDNVDLASESDSFFNSFTEAAATAFPSIRMIQLHGFNPKRHPLGLRKSFCDLILSPSVNVTNNSLIYNEIAHSLTENFPNFKICLFHRDVSILGGLKNINAKVFYIHAHPLGRFFHLETSLRLRKVLMKSQRLRKRFIECFTQN